MTNFEIIIVVLGVLNILSFGLIFWMFVQMSKLNIYTTQMATSLNGLLIRITSLERGVSRLAHNFEMFAESAEAFLDQINMYSGNMPPFPDMLGGPTGRVQKGQLFRTMDGKYSATSLDELIEQIEANGEEEKYLKDINQDFNNLKNLFEDVGDDNLFDDEISDDSEWSPDDEETDDIF